MNWLPQDPCMMLSSAQAPASQAGGVPVQAPGMHHHLPSTGPPGSSPEQIAYEGRLSLLANAAAGSPAGNWQNPPIPFNQLHFNLLHQFKPSSGSDDKQNGGPGGLFPQLGHHQDRDSSPSSSGSPRTDDTVDKTGDRMTDDHDKEGFNSGGEHHDEEPHDEEERDGRSSLDILQDHIRQLPKPVSPKPHNNHHDLDNGGDDVQHLEPEEEVSSSSPVPTTITEPMNSSPMSAALLPPPLTAGLTIRRDIKDMRRDGEDLRNISEEKEGIEEDFDEDEELRIDEEMLEEDRGKIIFFYHNYIYF